MGGAMELNTDKVESAMVKLAEQLDLDPVESALGIIRIVNASMAKAIRAVSLERGYDPQEFALFAFGGASGLHCCELASELQIKKLSSRPGPASCPPRVWCLLTRRLIIWKHSF